MTFLLRYTNRLETIRLPFLCVRKITQKLPQCKTEITKKYFVTCNKTFLKDLSKIHGITTKGQKNYWTSNQKPVKWNKVDKVPEDFLLIFMNSNEKNLKYIFMFIPLTILIVGSAGYQIKSGKIKWREPRRSSKMFDGQLLIIIFSLYFMVLLCVTKVYRLTVNRMYKHMKADLYVAVFPRFFFSTQNVAFRRKDITYPYKRFGRYAIGDVRIKKRPVLLDATDFAQPCYYNEIVGYN